MKPPKSKFRPEHAPHRKKTDEARAIFDFNRSLTLIVDSDALVASIAARIREIFDADRIIILSALDVRVIAATNLDLKSAVEHGRLREDLYWRLNVVRLTLPSLRQRREDIPLLVDHLLSRFTRELGLSEQAVSPDARRLLELYEWPGNVREMGNALCSAMIMSEGGIVSAGDLPPRIRREFDPSSAGAAPALDLSKASLAEAVIEAAARVEKIMIVSRLAACNGSRSATAESLSISRKTLFNKMRQYGLGDDDEDSAS